MNPTRLMLMAIGLFYAYSSALLAANRLDVLFIAVDDLRPELGCSCS
jgi:hypothetical protein